MSSPGLCKGRSRRAASLQLLGRRAGGGWGRGFRNSAQMGSQQGHWARTLRSLGADHVQAQYGGAGQAGGGDRCGCSPAGPWEGVRGQEHGTEGLGTGFGLKIRKAGVPMMGTQRNHVYLPLPRCPCLIPLNILASPQISLPSWGARACVWPCLTSLSLSWPGAGVLPAEARPRWGPPRAARSQSDPLPWDASGLQQRRAGAPSAAVILRPPHPDQSWPQSPG